MAYRRRTRPDHQGALPLGSLLERYRKKLRPPQGVVIEAFCAAAEAKLSVPLRKSSVRYNVHTQTISITASGPQKSEVLLHARAVLEECTDVLGAQHAPKRII